MGLLPGKWTPLLQEQAIRLGQAVPSFAEAGQILHAFTRVELSERTVRRLTEEAGALLVEVETAAVDTCDEEPAEPSAEKLVIATDGAMVPLRGGEWREVKTLTVGEIEDRDERPEAKCVNLSYFSRLGEWERFTSLAGVEIRRRGVPQARAVAAVSDGSEWNQGFADRHRRDAERILDFPHAAGYVAAVGDALFGKESGNAAWWTQMELHELKHSGGAVVLSGLRAWEAAVREPAVGAVISKSLFYLEKREKMLRYPEFQAAGWPIGSGMVESANKLVVERRLKGPGMHWAEQNVDPMLALRCAASSRRWEEAWRQIATARRARPIRPPARAAKT